MLKSIHRFIEKSTVLLKTMKSEGEEMSKLSCINVLVC